MEKKSKAGGSRVGSGRPKGTGKYKEATCAIRVPVSLLSEIKQLLALKVNRSKHTANHGFFYPSETTSLNTIPLYSSSIAAGLPSPVEDHIDDDIDLNQYLVSNPSDVFMVRANGDSMIETGIQDNDLLLVDRSITTQEGKVVIALLDGELTVKRLRSKGKEIWLLPENKNYSPIPVTSEQELSILGVVIHVIHSL